MEETYRKTGDIQIAAKELTSTYYHEYPDWVISPEILEGVFRQMLRHIARTLEKKSSAGKNS